jgi:hypothetical protein
LNKLLSSVVLSVVGVEELAFALLGVRGRCP